ncbi:MAG: hypothetical protein ABSD69_00200 [Candidatus Levyibacteriota bacterium]|jgi:hypothetical protein
MVVVEARPGFRQQVAAKLSEILILHGPPASYHVSPNSVFMGSPSIEGKTARLAETRACTSGTNASQVLEFYQLPRLPEKSLDICAGPSPLTAELLKRGVDAWALDYNYGDKLPILIRNASRHAEVSP